MDPEGWNYMKPLTHGTITLYIDTRPEVNMFNTMGQDVQFTRSLTLQMSVYFGWFFYVSMFGDN